MLANTSIGPSACISAIDAKLTICCDQSTRYKFYFQSGPQIADIGNISYE